MRQLSGGFTLVEILIAIAIGVLLLALGVPFYGDYIANARLREGGTAVHAELLHAQGEAIRRNAVAHYGATRGEIGWVLDDNQGMNAIADAIESHVNKEYTIYEKAL